MDRLVSLDIEADYVGKSALKRIQRQGVNRKLTGLISEGVPLEKPNTRFWPVTVNSINVGRVTSAVYSPRLKQNIALAMISSVCNTTGTRVRVSASNKTFDATVVDYPFYDPKKKVAKL